MGHGAGGLRDDSGVTGIGLGVARGQVRDPPHRQAGQVAHGDAHVLGHGDGQGSDGGGLVHDHQHPAVMGQSLVEVSQAGLVVGKGLVEQALAVPVQGGGPVVGLAHVDADEHVDAGGLHPQLPRLVGDRASLEPPIPHPRYERPRTGRSPDQR